MRGNDDASSGDRARLISFALREIAAGGDGDVIEAAHALTRWSLRLLDVSGAGVMMLDDRGVLRSMMVSSPAVLALEADELARGRGPCVESHRNARAVVHADFEVRDERWPEFGRPAGGMRAAHAIPVPGDGAAVGVLNLFRASIGGLTDADAALAQALADTAGDTACRLLSPARPALSAEQLAVAVADEAIIERAKGMLAVRLRIDIDTAAAVLRRVARDRGHSPGEVAATVVAGDNTITLPLSVGRAPAPPPSAPGTD